MRRGRRAAGVARCRRAQLPPPATAMPPALWQLAACAPLAGAVAGLRAYATAAAVTSAQGGSMSRTEGLLLDEEVGPGLRLLRQRFEVAGRQLDLITPADVDAVLDMYIEGAGGCVWRVCGLGQPATQQRPAWEHAQVLCAACSLRVVVGLSEGFRQGAMQPAQQSGQHTTSTPIPRSHPHVPPLPRTQRALMGTPTGPACGPLQ